MAHSEAAAIESRVLRPFSEVIDRIWWQAVRRSSFVAEGREESASRGRTWRAGRFGRLCRTVPQQRSRYAARSATPL